MRAGSVSAKARSGMAGKASTISPTRNMIKRQSVLGAILTGDR